MELPSELFDELLTHLPNRDRLGLYIALSIPIPDTVLMKLHSEFAIVINEFTCSRCKLYDVIQTALICTICHLRFRSCCKGRCEFCYRPNLCISCCEKCDVCNRTFCSYCEDRHCQKNLIQLKFTLC